MDFFKSLWSLNKAFSSYTMPMHEMIDKSIGQTLFKFQRAIILWIFYFILGTLSVYHDTIKSQTNTYLLGGT